jgi:hypothetical protein
MRYYAAWICRFVSVDPLQFEYPYYTPYQYAGNKPISFIDVDGGEEEKPQRSYLNHAGRQLDQNPINADTQLMYFPYSKESYNEVKDKAPESYSKPITIQDADDVEAIIKGMIKDVKKQEGKRIELKAYIVFNKENLTISIMRAEISPFDREAGGETGNPLLIQPYKDETQDKELYPSTDVVFSPPYAEESYKKLIIIGQIHTNRGDKVFEGYSAWTSTASNNTTSDSDAELAAGNGIPVYEIDIASGQINKVDPQKSKFPEIEPRVLLYNALNTPRKNATPSDQKSK